jgi:hypothetical protein
MAYSRREFIKMDEEQLDVMIKDIQANLKRMQLLQILGQQLELLINEGQPNLDSLLTSLKTEALVSGEEYGELRVTFAREAVSPSCTVKRSWADSDYFTRRRRCQRTF